MTIKSLATATWIGFKNFPFMYAIMVFQALTLGFTERIASFFWLGCYLVPIPKFMRKSFYSAWGWWWGANLEESSKPLDQYENLLAMFTREMKEGMRPIDENAEVVMPVDGSIVTHAELIESEDHKNKREQAKGLSHDPDRDEDDGCARGLKVLPVEIANRNPKARVGFMPSQLVEVSEKISVKGVDYSIQTLLGVMPPKPKEGHRYELCLIFLPGSEHHHFYSPYDWEVSHRIRIPGHLASLTPEYARVFPQMYWTNERVTMLGKWKHGFAAFCAVAATAFVGSIKLDVEPHLATEVVSWRSIVESLPVLAGIKQPHAHTRMSENAYGIEGRRCHVPRQHGGEKYGSDKAGFDVEEYENPHHYGRGDRIGHFEVGSGIAMIFECPIDYKVRDKTITPGSEFKIGEAMT